MYSKVISEIRTSYKTSLLNKFQKEFQQFLKKNASKIGKEVIFSMLNSHHRNKEILEFAEMTQSYDILINEFIN